MMASARPGERATSFVVACSLLSRFARQNDAAPSQLGLGIKGELRNQAAAPARPALLSVEIGILLGARGWGSVQFRFLWGTCSFWCEIWAGPLLYPVWKRRFRPPNSHSLICLSLSFFLLRRGRAAKDAGDN